MNNIKILGNKNNMSNTTNNVQPIIDIISGSIPQDGCIILGLPELSQLSKRFNADLTSENIPQKCSDSGVVVLPILYSDLEGTNYLAFIGLSVNAESVNTIELMTGVNHKHIS